jgi:hypothetical protein
MSKTYEPNPKISPWEYENGYYLTCQNNRLSNFICHLELYKMIIHLPGDILEFGVYKGVSLIQFLTFRDCYESSDSRKIIGFDIFGKFPDGLSKNEDLKFVERFENDGGYGISEKSLNIYLEKKGFKNYELIQGDINKTLPDFINNNPEKRFSLIHLDVDVFEPTITVLENTWDKLVPGGVLVLDDYGTVYGETIGVEEFFKNKDVKIQKLPYKNKPSYIIKE